MRLAYMDGVLRRLATEVGYRPAGWSAQASRAYRKIIQCIDAAANDADLRALRSLRMRPRPDIKPGSWSIQLDDTLLLVLSFKVEDSGGPAVLEFLNIKSEGAR